MNPDRWKIVNQIFAAALEIEPGERYAFVTTESNGDAEVQAEVELLLKADSEGGSFLNSPLISAGLLSSSAPASVGDVLCNRFRIVREIGEGGMGYVFEAFDSELSVPVAVKMIRPELAPDRVAMSRFRQEVRLALTITHPNVCRTFDLQREIRTVDGKRIDIVFLTMEFLAGETLATRISRDGKLPLAVAYEVASQIAAALQAAHGLGVIHRDIKPANIMLVQPRGQSEEFQRVVVTDFGLAQLEPSVLRSGYSNISKTGHPIGTLAYMAPEQLEGGTVSPSTDIYAFGLILFEMLTGQRVFPSNTLLSGIAKRLHGSLSLKQLPSSDVPANWRRAIEWCLAADPANRPKDAASVIAVLEGNRRGSLLRLVSRHAPLRLPLQRLYLGVGAILVAMAFSILGLRLYQSRADSKVNPGTLVYLTQVRNETGEKPFGSLTELIRASLSQSTRINLLEPARVEDILQQMTKSPESVIDAQTAREIAMRGGAARVVFATVTGSKGKYSLHVDIQQPDSTPSRYREHWSKSFSWQTSSDAQGASQISSEALTEVRAAGDWVRHEVGESANDIARLDTPPEDATTSNWEALESYSEGERLFRKRDLNGAVNELKIALQIDPHFAMANALLGDLEVQLNHPKEGFAAYGRALDLNAYRRLSLRERDLIKGIVAHDSADFEGAEAAYREYTLYYPNDYLAWFRLGRPLLMLDRPEESAEVLKRAYTLDSSHSGVVFQIVRAELVRGDLPAANYWLEQLKLHFSKAEYLYALGQADFLLGDYAGADSRLEEVARGTDSALASSAVQILADFHAERGDNESALEILNARLERTPNTPGLRIDRAQLECKAKKYDACLTDLRQVLASDASPRRMIAASAILGHSIDSAHGANRQKLREFLTSLDIPAADARLGIIFELARRRIRGEQLLADGKTKAALAEFLQADALDAPFMARDYLARALALAAADESNASQAREMVAKAHACLAAVALHPAVVWQFSPNYPPGFYADQLIAWLQLPDRSSTASTDRQAIEKALYRLRPAAANQLQSFDSGSHGRHLSQ